LSQHVDALLVINNEKLKEIHPDLELSNAFAKADDVLTNAAKAIAEIITVPGYINTDFADVYSIMKDGNVAIMNTGFASGENRITKAIEDALVSPLLNTSDVSGASKILLSLYCSTTDQIKMEEVEQIHDFMKKVGDNVQVIWGASFDDSLGEKVKITLIATGFDVSDIPGMPKSLVNKPQPQVTPSPKVIHSFESAQPVVNQEADAESTIKVDNEFNALSEFETEEENLKPDTDKAYELYYGSATKAPAEPEPEPALPTITLDDLEDEATLKEVENIPAWRRKLMRG
jgi:cell division protein FtsZ